MKKLFGNVSKRDMIFISIILLVMLAFLFLDSSVDILVNYDEEMLYVTSPRLNMDIRNADVVSVELADMPDLGEMVEGYAHETYCTGVWKNEDWGEYDLCVLPGLPQCIKVELSSGRIMVFTCSTEAKTAELYESYTSYRESRTA